MSEVELLLTSGVDRPSQHCQVSDKRRLYKGPWHFPILKCFGQLGQEGPPGRPHTHPGSQSQAVCVQNQGFTWSADIHLLYLKTAN